MKTNRITFWASTILFAGFMIFSAIPNIMGQAESINFITALGYPAYFIPFIGVAKMLGSLAILVPGYFRLKEWAYAGLFFDLMGDLYSLIQVHGFDASMSVMVIIIGTGALSYLFYHRLYHQKTAVA